MDAFDTTKIMFVGELNGDKSVYTVKRGHNVLQFEKRGYERDGVVIHWNKGNKSYGLSMRKWLPGDDEVLTE